MATILRDNALCLLLHTSCDSAAHPGDTESTTFVEKERRMKKKQLERRRRQVWLP